MSTSLSRQLEQLRTSSSQVSSWQSRDGATSLASLGPNLLDVQIGGEQLTVLAKESLRDLSVICPVLESFQSVLFRDDPDDPMPVDHMMQTDADEEKSIEDIFFLLSPHLLEASAQHVLQYLVTKHKVHIKYPELLLFSAIPYYQYKIFHRVVEALPTRFGKARAEEDFPRWVENFKTVCHPATKIGLTRHLASDQGFFKLFCHVLVQKLIRYHIKR